MKHSRLSYRYQRALLNRVIKDCRTPKEKVIGLVYMLRGVARWILASIYRAEIAMLMRIIALRDKMAAR